MPRRDEVSSAVFTEADFAGMEARVRGVAPAEPLLLVERVSCTYGDRPVEVRRGWYVTRGYHYFNELG
jgi:DNA-binding GntR family transcriptional regulator